MATYETIQKERRDRARTALEGYRAFCEMHESYLKLMQDGDSRLLSTTAQMGETIASGAAGDAIGSGLAKLETTSAKLRYVDDRICAKLDILAHLVERVVEINPAAGRVLNKYYIAPYDEAPSFGDIAKELNYSIDRVYALHLVGLDIVADLLEVNKF